MAEIKIGDAVPWGEVPDGAMIRDGGGAYAIKYRGMGDWVHLIDGGIWYDDRQWWLWSSGPQSDTPPPFTIVALDIPANATAADLQRFAEVFKVREAVAKQWGDDLADELAERLHAAGWRPGMTAEDAARLLRGDG